MRKQELCILDEDAAAQMILQMQGKDAIKFLNKMGDWEFEDLKVFAARAFIAMIINYENNCGYAILDTLLLDKVK